MNHQINIMKYTCPCCGYMTFDEALGSDEICDICSWHDDLVSYNHPDRAIGPNKVTLIQAQVNYLEFGISNPSLKKSRVNITNYPKDSLWRLIDLTIDKNLMNGGGERFWDLLIKEVGEPLPKYYWLSNNGS